MSLLVYNDLANFLNSHGLWSENMTSKDIYVSVINLIRGNPNIVVPTEIEDALLAVELTNERADIGIYNLTDIYMASNEDLIQLASQLGLAIVNRKRVIRVLTYIGRLNDNTSILTMMPIYLFDKIIYDLDVKSIINLCHVSPILCRRIIGKNSADDLYLNTLNIRQLRILMLHARGNKIHTNVYACGTSGFGRKNMLFGDRKVKSPLLMEGSNDIIDVSVGENISLYLSTRGVMYTTGNRSLCTENDIINTRSRRDIIGISPTRRDIVGASPTRRTDRSTSSDVGRARINPRDTVEVPYHRDEESTDLHKIAINVRSIAKGVSAYAQYVTNDGKVHSCGGYEIPNNDDFNIVAIIRGKVHGFVIDNNGRAYGWGSNYRGRLGIGPEYRHFTDFVQVPISEPIRSISASDDHSLFLSEDGRVYSCGFGEAGRLGLGDIELANYPVLIPELRNIIAVAAGNMQSLFLSEDGIVYVSGHNFHGILGLGDYSQVITTPIPNLYIKNVIAISAGSYISLFLKSDGTVYSCGHAGAGEACELTEFSLVPERIPNLNNVIAISSGDFGSIFVVADAIF